MSETVKCAILFPCNMRHLERVEVSIGGSRPQESLDLLLRRQDRVLFLGVLQIAVEVIEGRSSRRGLRRGRRSHDLAVSSPQLIVDVVASLQLTVEEVVEKRLTGSFFVVTKYSRPLTQPLH